MRTSARVTRAMLAVLVCMLVVSPALAGVELEGTWPDADAPVSIDAQRLPRSEAVRRLADAMGWSVVLHAPPADEVDLRVKDQPASKVLSMLLSDHDYIARRDGTLINIERTPSDDEAVPSPLPAPPPPPQSAPVAPESAPPAPPSPEASATPGNLPDRVISGGNVRVEKHEVVHDVVVFGGSADVLGKATGDVTVVGGSARVHDGAHVMGDATAVGGSLTVDDGAIVDGDVGVVGGTLHRGKEAMIRGSERTNDATTTTHTHGIKAWAADTASEIGSSITSAALMFVFGAILLALGTRRMDSLQSEVASRPMRTFALGVVGTIVFALLVIAFTLTVIGFPVAVIALLIAIVAAYAGVCAVLTVAGGALLRHKTKNPYVHLALGCAMFFVATAIPFVGNFAFLAVLLLGVGTMVATRGAGFFGKKRAVA